MKEGVEATLTSTQDQSGNTTKWWRNYPQQTTEQERERSLKTLYTQKNQLQHNMSTTAQQNIRRVWTESPSVNQLEGRTHQRKTQQ